MGWGWENNAGHSGASWADACNRRKASSSCKTIAERGDNGAGSPQGCIEQADVRIGLNSKKQ